MCILEAEGALQTSGIAMPGVCPHVMLPASVKRTLNFESEALNFNSIAILNTKLLSRIRIPFTRAFNWECFLTDPGINTSEPKRKESRW